MNAEAPNPPSDRSSSHSPDSTEAVSPRERWIAGLISIALVLLPIILVRWPPSGDLPQQFHQIVLAERTFRGLEPDLSIEVLAPNRLGYLPLAAGWILGGAREGPRIAVALVALVWVGALHLFAWKSGVGPANAVLASTFFFSRLLYCGFFNFLLGLLGMLVWMRELERDPERSSWIRLTSGAFLASALLYSAHVLWFVGGTAFVLSVLLLRRFDVRQTLASALGILPVALHLLFWAGRFGTDGWQSSMAWRIPPLHRLSSLTAFSELVLGGLRGRVELVVVVVSIAFVALGAARAIRSRTVPRLRAVPLAAGLLCLVAAIVLPTQLDQTVFFNARWAPFAMLFLLLAVPPPRANARLVLGLGLATLAALSVATAATWLKFERDGLAGFEDSLQAIPEGSKVIGLDLADPIAAFRWDPFGHLTAYAGVVRNARPSVSFTQLQSSLVVLRDPMHPPSWLPPRDQDRVRPSDLANYDLVLVRGDAARVERLRSIAPPTTLAYSSPAWTVLAVTGAAAGSEAP